ncbi:galactose-1-phosphate uridylyltransferase, partial [Trifolium pratense]
VFKNHGAAAGASMSHSHSQMIALPVIPPSVSARLGSMKDFFDQTGKCCICEIQRENLLIDSSTYFFSLVPYAASFPFEIWIVPRYHSAHFHELDAEKSVDARSFIGVITRDRTLNKSVLSSEFFNPFTCRWPMLSCLFAWGSSFRCLDPLVSFTESPHWAMILLGNTKLIFLLVMSLSSPYVLMLLLPPLLCEGVVSAKTLGCQQELCLSWFESVLTLILIMVQAIDLGGLLKQMLNKISLQLNDPPFNFMIHTSPLHGNESELAYTHWFIQIVPQLVGTAGFELATGCYINPVFPEDAAKVLREVNVSESG